MPASRPSPRITWRNGRASPWGAAICSCERDGPDRYLYKWTISARGIFRIVYSSDLTQKSWFSVVADHVRPERYLAEEGASSVSLAFDWDAGHARGMSENKPVDLQLKEGAQDLMSIQIEVMLDLKNGNLPGLFHIVDKDQLKDFVYSREGTATIRTAIGQLDTVIVCQPAHRQRPHLAHVVRAVARLRAGAGRTLARRQNRICHAHQEHQALAAIPGVQFRFSAT